MQGLGSFSNRWSLLVVLSTASLLCLLLASGCQEDPEDPRDDDTADDDTADDDTDDDDTADDDAGDDDTGDDDTGDDDTGDDDTGDDDTELDPAIEKCLVNGACPGPIDLRFDTTLNGSVAHVDIYEASSDTLIAFADFQDIYADIQTQWKAHFYLRFHDRTLTASQIVGAWTTGMGSTLVDGGLLELDIDYTQYWEAATLDVFDVEYLEIPKWSDEIYVDITTSFVLNKKYYGIVAQEPSQAYDALLQDVVNNGLTTAQLSDVRIQFCILGGAQPTPDWSGYCMQDLIVN